MAFACGAATSEDDAVPFASVIARAYSRAIAEENAFCGATDGSDVCAWAEGTRSDFVQRQASALAEAWVAMSVRSQCGCFERDAATIATAFRGALALSQIVLDATACTCAYPLLCGMCAPHHWRVAAETPHARAVGDFDDSEQIVANFEADGTQLIAKELEEFRQDAKPCGDGVSACTATGPAYAAERACCEVGRDSHPTPLREGAYTDAGAIRFAAAS